MANDVPGGTRLQCDVCVVGGGAAGLTLASELMSSGLDVIVLEAGDERRARDLDPFKGEVIDPTRHSFLHHYRERRLGGTTAVWGGGCVPFDPIDFERRPYVPMSGWPIAAADVAPYYPRAARYLEIGACEFDAADAVPDAAPTIAGLASPEIETERLHRFSPPTNFALLTGEALRAAPDVRLVCNAAVVNLALAADGRRVERVEAMTPRGRLSVRARLVVLALGGLETTRLLLASNDVAPAGIGNAHDQLGRYYMCHLTGSAGAIRFRRPPVDGYELTRDGVYCRRRLAHAAAAQRRLGLLNVAFRLEHAEPSDPRHGDPVLSALYLVKHIGMGYHWKWAKPPLTPAFLMRHASNVLRRPVRLLRFARQWIERRVVPRRKLPSVVVPSPGNVFDMQFMSEQAPNRDSRVTLGETRDAMGMPRLKVDWQPHPLDLPSVEMSFAAIASAIEAAGAGVVEHRRLRWEACGGHHIGTTRMSADPRDGVVDADCRVHGVDNLFIASSSVFPTSSHANPTMLVVALAIRLADHLALLLQDARVPAGTER